MPVYNRQDSLAEEVDNLQQAVDDFKSTQIVGNDNLVVYIYIGELFSNAISAGATAIFKATFTFDEPSNAYVDKSFTFQVNSGTFSYVDVPYDDPTTSTSTTAKSWYYAFTPSAACNIYIKAVARCTQTGAISLTRIA